MNVIQLGEQDICFISSREVENSNDQDLLKMTYTRIQKESPNFLTLYEGVDQNVDIKMTTLVFRAAPEPVLALYDFIMSTFVSNSDQVIPSNPDQPRKDNGRLETSDDVDSKIRVLVKLEGVQGMFSTISMLKFSSWLHYSHFKQQYDELGDVIPFNCRYFRIC